MAESVDALVSNTSGATRAGSTPALGTKNPLRLSSERVFLFGCTTFAPHKSEKGLSLFTQKLPT